MIVLLPLGKEFKYVVIVDPKSANSSAKVRFLPMSIKWPRPKLTWSLAFSNNSCTSVFSVTSSSAFDLPLLHATTFTANGVVKPKTANILIIFSY